MHVGVGGAVGAVAKERRARASDHNPRLPPVRTKKTEVSRPAPRRCRPTATSKKRIWSGSTARFVMRLSTSERPMLREVVVDLAGVVSVGSVVREKNS